MNSFFVEVNDANIGSIEVRTHRQMSQTALENVVREMLSFYNSFRPDDSLKVVPPFRRKKDSVNVYIFDKPFGDLYTAAMALKGITGVWGHKPLSLTSIQEQEAIDILSDKECCEIVIS